MYFIFIYSIKFLAILKLNFFVKFYTRTIIINILINYNIRVNIVINFIINKCMYNNIRYVIQTLCKLCPDGCYNHTYFCNLHNNSRAKMLYIGTYFI